MECNLCLYRRSSNCVFPFSTTGGPLFDRTGFGRGLVCFSGGPSLDGKTVPVKTKSDEWASLLAGASVWCGLPAMVLWQTGPGVWGRSSHAWLSKVLPLFRTIDLSNWDRSGKGTLRVCANFSLPCVLRERQGAGERWQRPRRSSAVPPLLLAVLGRSLFCSRLPQGSRSRKLERKYPAGGPTLSGKEGESGGRGFLLPMPLNPVWRRRRGFWITLARFVLALNSLWGTSEKVGAPLDFPLSHQGLPFSLGILGESPPRRFAGLGTVSCLGAGRGSL